jgi:hypothetical protein
MKESEAEFERKMTVNDHKKEDIDRGWGSVTG